MSRHYYTVSEYKADNKCFTLFDSDGNVDVTEESLKSLYDDTDPSTIVGCQISVSFLDTVLAAAIKPKIEYNY